jgi:hypothetical protein
MTTRSETGVEFAAPVPVNSTRIAQTPAIALRNSTDSALIATTRNPPHHQRWDSANADPRPFVADHDNNRGRSRLRPTPASGARQPIAPARKAWRDDRGATDTRPRRTTTALRPPNAPGRARRARRGGDAGATTDRCHDDGGAADAGPRPQAMAPRTATKTREPSGGGEHDAAATPGRRRIGAMTTAAPRTPAAATSDGTTYGARDA